MTNKRAGTRPPWLKIRVPGDLEKLPVTGLIRDLGLNTVCQEARCPNIFECWTAGTATFMILGETCTRRCTFCAVGKGQPLVPDPGEPERVALAVERMGVKHCVITTVNRDDLPDGGAAHFARTIEAVRARTGASVEVLISDLQGNRDALESILAARPEVLAHNVETIPRLYLQVRPGSRYQRSLDILRWASEWRHEGMYTKSSLMLGLGETEDEVLAVARELREAGVDIFTMGQYLAPTERNHPVRRYWTPDEFAGLGERARALGFHHVESGPLVRSSYMAHRAVESPAEAAHAEGHVR
jgi:lipoic acid synthetase